MKMEHFDVYKGEIVNTPTTFKQKIIRTVTITVLIGAAIFAALALASPGRADSNSYLSALAVAGYVGSDQGWINRGWDICQLENAGVPQSVIASKIVATTGAGIYTADAYEVIGIANVHLCYSGNSVA